MLCSVLLTVLCCLTALPASADAPPPFDVPRLDGITVDGKPDDWGDRGFRVEVMTPSDGQHRPVTDHDATLRLAWDGQGLLMLMRVHDEANAETKTTQDLWRQDCVELFIADAVGGPNMVQGLVGPGFSKEHAELRQRSGDFRKDKALKERHPEPTFEAARTITDTGFVLEVRLPFEPIGVTPELGDTLGFQVYSNDNDGGGGRDILLFHPGFGTHADTKKMHALRLADKPSPPVLAGATADYDKFRAVVAHVRAAPSMSGKTVALREGDRVLVEGVLIDVQGRAAAELIAPMPPADAPYQALAVTQGDTAIATITLPDPAPAKARAFIEADLHADYAVFSGNALPAFKFTQPLYIENLIGRYTIETAYYNSDFQKVTTAQTPGRYGAVVTITGADGSKHVRHRTLFRQPEEAAHWTMPALIGSVKPAPRYGIDDATADAHAEQMTRWLTDMFYQQNNRNSAPAVWLAGMYDASREEGQAAPVTRQNDPWARDRQYWVTLKRKLNGNAERYAETFTCPKKIAGEPAPVLRAGTPAEAGFTDDTPAKLDALLTEWAEASGEPFIAVVARHGVVIHHKAYGERDGQPMTVHTPSYMASLTKLMSGTAAMMLVDQGLLDLDANIAEVLPELAGIAVEQPATSRMLFTHTADMWGHWGDFDNDFEHLVADVYPHLKIGTKHQYNGMSLALGSKVIEQVTGEALPQFYQNHLFGPLGMNDTTATNTSYDAQSTAHDMAVFGQMLLNGGAYGNQRFFSKKTRDAMLPRKLTMILGPDTEKTWGIGCTWMNEKGKLSDRTFGHGSASRATLRIDLDHGLVIAMTRRTAGKDFGKYHDRFIQTIVDGVVK